jgi:RNA 3'-terminal phosphate cyclase (ATP)
LVLEGGTHNPWAPPFDFLARAYLPLVSRMGPRVTATLARHGFYPAGGGRFEVAIEPCRALAGFELLERGPVRNGLARAIVANLPAHIGEREIKTILEAMDWPADRGRVEEVAASGSGNAVCIEIESAHVTEVFTAFGRLGVRAERVAAEAVEQARRYLAGAVPVGPYLADQLILPLGISAWQPGGPGMRRGGAFRTLVPTAHTTTHVEILRRFLEVQIGVEALSDGSFRINVDPPKAG